MDESPLGAKVDKDAAQPIRQRADRYVLREREDREKPLRLAIGAEVDDARRPRGPRAVDRELGTVQRHVPGIDRPIADQYLADVPDARSLETHDAEYAAGARDEADRAKTRGSESGDLEDSWRLPRPGTLREHLGQGLADHHLDDRSLVDLVDRYRVDHPTVTQNGHLVADLEQLVKAMRHVERRPALLAEATQHREQALCVLQLERSGRFVEDEDPRLPRERLRNLNDLLLTDVERLDPAVGTEVLAVAEQLEQLAGPSSHGATIEHANAVAQLDSKRDVLGDRESGDQRELLVNDADAEAPRVIGAAQLQLGAVEAHHA